jgi:hypothetical protein
VHQFADQDFAAYFDAVEPVFWKYEAARTGEATGSTRAARAMYPRFQRIREVRRAPIIRLMNAHLGKLLGI